MDTFFKILGKASMFCLLLATFFFLLASGVASAADSSQLTIGNPSYPWQGANTPASFVARFYQIALGFVGAAALAVILYGAILYTVSAGNTSKQSEARKWMTGAVLGLILLLAAYLILYIINPSLVNLVNPAAEPVNLESAGGTGQLSTAQETALGNEKGVRGELAQKGIGVNKPPCVLSTDTNCTNVSDLPDDAIEGLVKIKQDCNLPYLTITGGAEAGHQTHGPGQPIVDIRLKSSGGSVDTNLLSCMQNDVGFQSGIVLYGSGSMPFNTKYTAKDGSFSVVREQNASDNTQHFHIVFK